MGHWNDYIAVISCITAPIFIQFAFASNTMFVMIADTIPIVAIVALCGFLLSIFTFWQITKKYKLPFKVQQNECVQRSDNIQSNHANIYSVVSSMGGQSIGALTRDHDTAENKRKSH